MSEHASREARDPLPVVAFPAQSPEIRQAVASTEAEQLIVQTKLTVGPAGDAFEREADAVADRVVRALQHSPRASKEPNGESSEPRIQRRTPRYVGAAPVPAPSGRSVQRGVAIGPAGGETDQDTGRRIQSARGGGRAMRASVRAPMEEAFSTDFSQVRIHEGPAASELNQRIQARAFTVGNDIFFRDGAPDATSASGQHLLAHELTHTLQQGGGARRRDVDPGNNFHAHPTTTPPTIQRVMNVKEFRKKSSITAGLRNKVSSVDRALKTYLACDPDDADGRLGAIRSVIASCDVYLQLGDGAKRKPGVQTLRDQAVRDQAIYLPYAAGVAAVDPVQRVNQFNTAKEAHRLAFAVQPVDAINIGHHIATTLAGMDQAQQRAVTASDVQSLTTLSVDPAVPDITRRILVELLNNLAEIKISAGLPGAKQKRPWEGRDQGYHRGESFAVSHSLEQIGGKPERLGSLAHELTHVSVGKSYQNSSFFLMVSSNATPKEIKEKAEQRSGRIDELKDLIAADEVLTPDQLNLVTSKVDYAVEDKLGLYIDRYYMAAEAAAERAATAADAAAQGLKPDKQAVHRATQTQQEQKRDFFKGEADRARQICKATFDAGFHSSLFIEYDTVINQMLIYLHMWNIDTDHLLYKKLRGDRLRNL